MFNNLEKTDIVQVLVGLVATLAAGIGIGIALQVTVAPVSSEPTAVVTERVVETVTEYRTEIVEVPREAPGDDGEGSEGSSPSHDEPAQDQDDSERFRGEIQLTGEPKDFDGPRPATSGRVASELIFDADENVLELGLAEYAFWESDEEPSRQQCIERVGTHTIDQDNIPDPRAGQALCFVTTNDHVVYARIIDPQPTRVIVDAVVWSELRG